MVSTGTRRILPSQHVVLVEAVGNEVWAWLAVEIDPSLDRRAARFTDSWLGTTGLDATKP